MYLDLYMQACRDIWSCNTAEKCVLMGRGEKVGKSTAWQQEEMPEAKPHSKYQVIIFFI